MSSNYDLSSWSRQALHQLAAELDPQGINAPLAEAIRAELADRKDRLPKDLDWSDVEADALRMREEQELRDHAADVLARLILDGEDFPGDLEALAPVLPQDLWEQLAARVEACPVHVCDVLICRDDQDPSCPAGRESAQAAQLAALEAPSSTPRIGGQA